MPSIRDYLKTRLDEQVFRVAKRMRRYELEVFIVVPYRFARVNGRWRETFIEAAFDEMLDQIQLRLDDNAEVLPHERYLIDRYVQTLYSSRGSRRQASPRLFVHKEPKTGQLSV